jgi:hypothetical protein
MLPLDLAIQGDGLDLATPALHAAQVSKPSEVRIAGGPEN